MRGLLQIMGAVNYITLKSNQSAMPTDIRKTVDDNTHVSVFRNISST